MRGEGIFIREMMQQRGHPAATAYGLPDAPTGTLRVAVKFARGALAIVGEQGFIEIEHVARGEIQTFRASRRNDMRRVACQKQLAIAHRLGDEAAQWRDTLLNRRADLEACCDIS